MTQKLLIEPVTRIEGHARVSIYLDDDGAVDRAYFHVDQYRGFEKFCEGRMFFEMPNITPRICGICPVSHHLASVKACDAIIGVKPPRTASLLRELMHMGQIIQSHGMHFFHLAGPDLLLGFDADPAIRNVVGLMERYPELAIKAVKLRKFGQEIIKTLGEKKVHPTFAVPGGVNKVLTVDERDAILAGLNETISITQEGINIATGWLEGNSELVKRFANFDTGHMGMIKDGALELYDGDIRLIDCDGTVLEEFEPEGYLNHIGERVEDWSYLKFPFYKKKGWPDGVYRVGPLGRLNAASCVTTPLAAQEFERFKAIGEEAPVQETLYYHYARLIELLYVLEHTRDILEDPDILSKEIRAEATELREEGVGCIEAPRGTLFHHYWVDENGIVTKANLIVATGHNNYAMSKSVEAVAKEFIKGQDITEGMLNRIEAAIRCYDPCLSCSTHAIGKMPLIVEIFSPSGEALNVLKRT